MVDAMCSIADSVVTSAVPYSYLDDLPYQRSDAASDRTNLKDSSLVTLILISGCSMAQY